MTSSRYHWWFRPLYNHSTTIYITTVVLWASHCDRNKLCGKPRNMPPPLYAAHCSPTPAHTRLTPAAPSALAPWIFVIVRQRLALGGGVDYSVDRPYKLCSDLNSQPKRPGDLDLWPFDLESGVRVTCDVGYLCANFSLPSPLCLELCPMYATDRQTDLRQTDIRQTDVISQTKSLLNAPAY